MEWHIITGEYPPQPGGVSDYTFHISRELAHPGDRVHVWTPVADRPLMGQDKVEVHALPRGFGLRWLLELDRHLRAYAGTRTILIQYVPHMYGWKSMNLAFCFWIWLQRKQNLYVMFHEVAFPFERGQRFRHRVLAIVHRCMAWGILHSARHSFTSTDHYLDLLRKLGSNRTPVSMLRICSNVPLERFRREIDANGPGEQASEHFTVGIFSSFGPEFCKFLRPVIVGMLENPRIRVLLIGPGQTLCESLAIEHPDACDRISATGRLSSMDFDARGQRCDALLQIYPQGASVSRGTLVAALASGLPVVTTAGPATDQFLLKSKAMLLAKSTPECIRECLEMLMSDPSLAYELGCRAQSSYRESFDPGVIAYRLRDIASAIESPGKLASTAAVSRRLPTLSND